MTAVSATLRLRREGALRSRAARGDAAAFAAVYERHHQALYRYCRSILRHEEDAQDALQSTMTRAFAALQDERRDFELRPWLFRIAHNEAISILRRRRETTELDDVPGEMGELEDRVSDREVLRLLQLDLADLPDRQRAALVLRELNGLSHVEIGQVLELSPAAVKQAIFEARNALFSCREGREMACHDIRRMLSDGDGRVLRGRGVRAHLRTCAECKRFHADLQERPRALRMLAPPLPIGSAAALLSQILGAGGGAAKLLACVAIAGGGTTFAVEMRETGPPTRPAPQVRVEPTAPRRPAPVKLVSVPQPQTSEPQTPAPTSERTASKRRHAPRAGKRDKTARGERPAATGKPPHTGRPAVTGKPEPTGHHKPTETGKPATVKKPKKGKPENRGNSATAHNQRGAAKPVKAEKVKAEKPAKAKAPVIATEPVETAAAVEPGTKVKKDKKDKPEKVGKPA